MKIRWDPQGLNRSQNILPPVADEPESFRLLIVPLVVLGGLKLKIRWDCARTPTKAGDLFDEKVQWHPDASTTKGCAPEPEEKKEAPELQEILDIFVKNSYLFILYH
jgi:hypothetical protein